MLMAEKYKIGRHEFETREEWENALKDLQKIKIIVEQADIDNPEDLLVVYSLLRDGDITFNSELGAAFFCDISDRVAKNSQDLLDGKEPAGLTEKALQQSKVLKIAGIACMVLAILCILFYTGSVMNERRSTRKLEQLQEQKSISQAVNWYISRLRDGNSTEQGTEETAADTELPQDGQKPAVLEEYQGLYASYPELIGWLHIEDTKVDLPVMQTTDNEHYLHYNIDGSEDKNGTLFLDYRDDITKPSTNFIIYGHNMKSGEMFGGLKQYLETDYASAHSTIRFDTIYQKQTYELVAVCLSRVGYEDDESNHYYNFIDSAGADDFQTFMDEVRESAVFDNTQEVSQEDQLLTLSTCNSYVEDGRLFLVAKKIQ